MTEDHAPGEWLTVTEAAARLGVSEKTLRKRIKSGQIEAQKVTLPAGGVAWRVTADALNGAVGPLPRLEAVGRTIEGTGILASEREGGVKEAKNTALEANGTESVGIVPHREGIEKERSDPALVGRVDALSNEVEQLKAFIAGGAMQAISERLAILPDAEALRALMVENQEQTAQMTAQAVKDGLTEALQADSIQRAEMVTKDDLVQAVEQGIAAAVKDADAEERASTAQALADSQKPVIESLAKVLERMTWLEEDNANLRKELEAQREQRQGFFGRLFKKNRTEVDNQ